MSGPTPKIKDVMLGLGKEGLCTPEDGDAIAGALQAELDESPWYVRVMIGFGAWVASLFLMVFIAGLSWLASEQESFIVLGIITLILCAIARRFTTQMFVIQMLLAFSLAGQGLFTAGVALTVSDANLTLVLLMLVQVILFAANPDRTHRFLCVIALLAELVILLYVNEMPILVHVVVAILAGLFVWLALVEGTIYAHSFHDIYHPAKYGVLLGMLGTMLLSTLYLFPELNRSIVFFPSPWIATLTLGTLLLFVVYRIMNDRGLQVRDAVKVVLLPGTFLFVLLSWYAPGLVMSMLILVLGFYTANRGLMAIATGFFVIFLTAFFYGIEVSLLHKSYTLMGTGLALMGAWYLLRLSVRQRGELADA